MVHYSYRTMKLLYDGNDIPEKCWMRIMTGLHKFRLLIGPYFIPTPSLFYKSTCYQKFKINFWCKQSEIQWAELSHRLHQNCKVNPNLYARKWITLIMTSNTVHIDLTTKCREVNIVNGHALLSYLKLEQV